MGMAPGGSPGPSRGLWATQSLLPQAPLDSLGGPTGIWQGAGTTGEKETDPCKTRLLSSLFNPTAAFRAASPTAHTQTRPKRA